MDNIKDLFELFRSKSQAGKDFEDKHVVHTRDDANGNGDEVFKGSKVKPVDRKKTRLGYNSDEDHKVYEGLSENYTIKSMGHENVHLLYKGKLVKKFADPREAKMYLAKMQKREVEEQTDLTELSSSLLGRYVKKSADDEAARKKSGIEWRDRVRKETGLNVGTPLDKKLYSPTASRKVNRERAINKLVGKARVNATESFELSEDDIIDAIEEMAKIEGIELTEDVFNELYTVMTSELNETKATSVRESFIKKYVEPEMVPHTQRIQEELSYLPESQLNLLLDLYEDLNEQNKAIFRKNLGNPEMINNFVDFALTNGDNE